MILGWGFFSGEDGGKMGDGMWMVILGMVLGEGPCRGKNGLRI